VSDVELPPVPDLETRALLADPPPATLEGPLLASDPFAEPDGPDPLRTRLELLERSFSARARAPRARKVAAVPAREIAVAVDAAAPVPLAREPRPRPRRTTVLPTLGEIELPEPQGLDRFLGEDVRRVLASLSHLVEGEGPYDRFGFSPEVIRRAFPIFHALYKGWFRVESEGHAHVPETGPALLVSNHAGLLPFDAAMTIIDLAMKSDPPRLARAIVDRWAGTLPWVNVFYSRVGQVIGTRENFNELLDDGQLVLVYPEGVEGIRKTVAQRYRLQSFRVGFVEHALRWRAPIVPMAVIGSDDQTPVLFDVKPLARLLGLPAVPITPTFPWLGPLGLLPYPVRYRIVYGEPLNFHQRFGPEGADDARLVRYLANQVRRAVQQLIDRNR
jgi:1-acyl-sn-glycerol-3-phosphate acyltransferase